MADNGGSGVDENEASDMLASDESDETRVMRAEVLHRLQRYKQNQPGGASSSSSVLSVSTPRLSLIADANLAPTSAALSILAEKDSQVRRLSVERNQLRDSLARQKSSLSRLHVAESERNAERKRASELDQRVQQLLAELAEAKAQLKSDAQGRQQLASVIGRLAEQQRRAEDAEAAAESARKEVSEANRRIADLETALLIKEQALEESSQLLAEVRATLDDMHAVNSSSILHDSTIRDESTMTVATSSTSHPTDAGDSTRIFHMRNNPLKAAHQEMIDEMHKAKKRKTSGGEDHSVCQGDCMIEVERLRTELQQQKKRAEKEITIMQNVTQKYREMCILLTGWELRLKAEGTLRVSSLYDPSASPLLFQVNLGTRCVDVLDCDAANRWSSLMAHYIGGHNSVPGFLAAATLQLVQPLIDRSVDLTSIVQQSFTVLHDA